MFCHLCSKYTWRPEVMWTNQKQGLLSGRSLNPTTLQRFLTLFSNVTVFIYKGWFSEERKQNNDVCVSATRSQQLCVKLEPRGLLYVKLSLQEKWDTQVEKRAACVHDCSITTGIVSHCLLTLLSPSAAHQDQRMCLEWSYTTSWRRKSPPSPSLCSSRSV